MKKGLMAALAVTLALPLFAEKLENLPLVDAQCGAKLKTEEDADKHDRNCLLMCEKNGYAVLKDGKLLKLDAKGNELAAAAVAKSSKTDHFRVTVEGEVKDDTLAVTTLTLD